MHNREYGAGSHVGRVRQHNEDYHIANPQDGLWLIADGMGGHQAGEVASKIVAETIASAIKQGVSVTEAVAHSHQAIADALAQGKGARGMGSTVVALQMDNNNYKIAWVGDSRAYLSRHGTLHRLTHDHTFVQSLLDAGIIGAWEAERHPGKNQLTQALGPTETAKLDIAIANGRLHPDEEILLCSDGLTAELSEQQIAAILNEKHNAQRRVDLLIQAALDAGGRDNITVLLIPAQEEIAAIVAEDDNIQSQLNVHAGQDTQPIPTLRPNVSSYSPWLLILAALLLITALGLSIIGW
jgi:protein phosphatase